MSSEGAVTEAFTEMAPDYEGTVDRELRRLWGFGYRQFVERFVDMAAITEGAVVLDVATGTALIPMQLANLVGAKGWIVGLDITPGMLAQAQRNLDRAGISTRIDLTCASGLEMPFPAAIFDVVLCGLGTHHMDVPQMLSEMRRILKPGGRLVLADVGASPFWRSLWGRIWLRILMVQFGLTHSRARTQAETEAFANMWSAGQWRAFLSEREFVDINITESRPRHAWYPSALLMTALADSACG